MFLGPLKLSTAVTVEILMVSSTNHIAGKTGLAAGLTIYASKAGGASAVITPTVAEIDATNMPGVYSLALTTTHTNTLGQLHLTITATGADPSDHDWTVGTNLASESSLQTGDSFARLGAPAGASISADIAAVKVDTAAVKVQTDKLAFTVPNQVDANVLKVGGTTQTARDLGASVLLSPGTGTGQVDLTSGVVKANLVQILATALTETAGLLAAGFKKFFNVAGPTLTIGGSDQTGDNFARLGAPAGASVSADIAAIKADSGGIKTQTDKLAFTVPNQVDANVIDWKSATAPAMTGDAFARLGAPAGASVSADVASVKTSVGAVTGAVGSVTGNVGGSVASVVAPVAITSNIKKNQALAKFEFLMTDATTHAPKTGLTPTCTRSIDGGAFAAGTLANVAEIGVGVYSVDFGAGDLNGSVITLRATAAASDDAFERLTTQP